MDYRRLGNTTLEVSEIGMGCEGFVDKNEKQIAGLVDLMEREGVNYLDLYTPNPPGQKRAWEGSERTAGEVPPAGSSVHNLEERAV